MPSPSDIVVTALGMISAVGSNAIESCAAVRGGLNGFREYGLYSCLQEDPRSPTREPVVASMAHPGRPGDVIDLFASAIQDLVQNAALGRRDFGQLVLYAALPSVELSPRNAMLRAMFMDELYRRSGLPEVKEAKLMASGHPGALLAAQDAQRRMVEGEIEACIVAGADSYIDLDTLRALDAGERLKSRRNQNGFIPGEAAVALLLERSSVAARRGAPILAVLEGKGLGREPQPITSGDPSTAEGLCKAAGEACSPRGEAQPISWVLCDLNGEAYRAKEWGLARVRLGSILGGARHVWHPADCLGDVGAATGGALLGIAARAFQRGYAPASRALVYACSDDGLRAALTLAKA